MLSLHPIKIKYRVTYEYIAEENYIKNLEMLYYTCKKKNHVVFTANQAVFLEQEFGMMVFSRTFDINFSSSTLICI